jgi:hypothetical protein
LLELLLVEKTRNVFDGSNELDVVTVVVPFVVLVVAPDCTLSMMAACALCAQKAHTARVSPPRNLVEFINALMSSGEVEGQDRCRGVVGG